MANIGKLQEERVFLRHAPMRWTSLENQNRRHCRELNRGPYFGGEAGGGGAPWGAFNRRGHVVTSPVSRSSTNIGDFAVYQELTAVLGVNS